TSATLAQTVRVAFGGIRVQQAVATGHGTGVLPTNVVSLPTTAPRQLTEVFTGTNVQVVFEDTNTWIQRASRLADADPAQRTARKRLLVPEEQADAITAPAHSPETGLYTQPVTSAGRLEMFPFVGEQSVTMPAHRFGTLNDLPQRALGDIHFGQTPSVSP